MTRLVEDDIREIEKQMVSYDSVFRSQTGFTMAEVAMKMAGYRPACRKYKAAVVSVTGGLGVISGFAKSVGAILKHCGIDTYVSQKPDVDGIYEASSVGAEVIFMADDVRYLAFSLIGQATGDNGDCTGAGFAQALLCAMGEEKEKVLVLGASNVGKPAAMYLLKAGILVDIYDVDPQKTEALPKATGLTVLTEAPDLKKYRYLFDATTAADIIGAEDVTEKTVIAAPGMPLGVTKEACDIAKVIHNPLELGTISMYYECAAKLSAMRGEE